MAPDRRDFLKTAAALFSLGEGWTAAVQPQRILISCRGEDSFQTRLAQRELMRGLAQLELAAEVRLAGTDEQPGTGELAIGLRVEPGSFQHSDSYRIAASGGAAVITAPNGQALLYAVFGFLEKQGALFGIDGENYPLDPPGKLRLPSPGPPWTAEPRFAVRGLLPWPDFLNCITVYNEEDFRAYFEAMLRMRFNTFGMHVYTGPEQWAESYLSFDFAGAGHLAYLDTSATNRWGYLPERTSRYRMGGSQFYDGETFGSGATRLAADPWETAERTRQMLRAAFNYAGNLGIRTGIGFEPYQIPDEIWRALPPEVRPEKMPPRDQPGARFDIESVTARDLLECRIANLLESYPSVDYVWLWEDEQMNWESRKTGQPLSITPFVQAHTFLKRHAPKKKLVLSGWGGVSRHFADFHKRLPGDIIFACLSDSLGWDPINEVFGELNGRERWPIPWIEDDPSMWLPQFHVNRFQRDLDLAAGYGCQGVLGIHWRQRIIDSTAMYQARFSWDGSLTPAEHFRTYAATQASGTHVGTLGEILQDADRNQKLLSTSAAEIKDGHVVTREFSGDYSEAFTFWADYAPSAGVLASQKQIAAALRSLSEGAASPLERERLEYLDRYVGMLVPYADAWVLAHRLNLKLGEARKLKASGNTDEARDKVLHEGVPLWLELAPEVRQTMLDFQHIVANRNDLGQLASMHNKFVRLALVRLRLSIKEFLGELTPETERVFVEMTQPDASAPDRLFVPTRPTMLRQGQEIRLTAVVPGNRKIQEVLLYTRPHRAAEWTATRATLAGRRTYHVALGPFAPQPAIAEYYVSARLDGAKDAVVAPPGGAQQPYRVTLLD
jgi:hypothetical protein